MKKNIGIFFICVCLFGFQFSLADQIVGCGDWEKQAVCGRPAPVGGPDGPMMGLQAPKIYENKCYLQMAGASLLPLSECNFVETYGVSEERRKKIDAIITKFRSKLNSVFGNNNEKKKVIISQVLVRIEQKLQEFLLQNMTESRLKIINVLKYLKAQLRKLKK